MIRKSASALDNDSATGDNQPGSMRRIVFLSAFFAIIIVGCATNCPTVVSCGGVKQGDRIEITVVDLYDKNSQYTYRSVSPFAGTAPECGYGPDIQQNQVIEATVTDQLFNRVCPFCWSSGATYQSVNGWNWTLVPSDVGVSGDILVGNYNLSSGACSATAYISVMALDDTPFATSTPGELPHAILSRSMGSRQGPPCSTVPVSASGFASCEEVYVVNLRKL